MLVEHSQVALERAIPSLGLESGDLGVVVHIYGSGKAYEVEFLTMDGNTTGVATVNACDLRTVSAKTMICPPPCAVGVL